MEQYNNEEPSPLLKNWEVSKLSSLEVSEDNDNDNNNDSDSGGFDCNICLESVEDPVVTFCGHIYCWPCIYKWLHHHQQPTQPPQPPQPQQPSCPVCKAKISEKTLIPLYGRGQSGTKGSENTALSSGIYIPERPQRLEMERTGMQGSLLYPQPTIGMFGELAYAGMFGDREGEATLYASYSNSYGLPGVSGRRMRRRMVAVDRSLSRICFFLFCCLVLCLLLF